MVHWGTNFKSFPPKNIHSIYMCDRVDQLPLFPYTRGWETQPNSRGLKGPIIRIPIKGGRSPIPKKTRLLTMVHIIFFPNPLMAEVANHLSI